MTQRVKFLFPLLLLGIAIVFALELAWGTVSIPLDEVWRALSSKGVAEGYDYIVRELRLPRALTALVAGAGVAVSGLMMQSLFRNPLADTSILGINSGAGVGVALYTMLPALFPSFSIAVFGGSAWGIAMASCLGSFAVLLLVSTLSIKLGDMVSILIVGIMIGFLASALITILQFFSSEEMLKGYLLWSFGSVSGTSWGQLHLLLPFVGLSLILSLLLPKTLNALALGDRYALSVGTNVVMARLALIALTSILTGSITAFTGPIAFLGMAVPHFVRQALRSGDHSILVPMTMLSGSFLLLLCDLLTHLPGTQFILPINALTAIIGAPVVIMVILGKGKRKNIL